MERQNSQCRVVGVRQTVDDRVEGVTADEIIVQLRGCDEVVVVGGCQERIWQVTEEVFEQSRDGGDVVMEGIRVSEIDARRI